MEGHKIEGISPAVLRAFENIVGLDGVHIKVSLNGKNADYLDSARLHG